MVNYAENPHQLYFFLNKFIEQQNSRSILYLNEYPWTECPEFLKKCTSIHKLNDWDFESNQKFYLVVAMLPLAETRSERLSKMTGFSKRFAKNSPGYIYSQLCKNINKTGFGIFTSANSGLGDDFYQFTKKQKYYVNSIASFPIQIQRDCNKSRLTASFISQEKKDFSVYLLGEGKGYSIPQSSEFADAILGAGPNLPSQVYASNEKFISINETRNSLYIQNLIDRNYTSSNGVSLVWLEKFGKKIKSIKRYNILDSSFELGYQDSSIYIKEVMEEENCMDVIDLSCFISDFSSNSQNSNYYWSESTNQNIEEFWVWRLEFVQDEDRIIYETFYKMLFRTSFGKKLCESFFDYFKKVTFSEENCRNALMLTCSPAIASNLVLRQFAVEEAADYFVELQDRFFKENPDKTFGELLKAKFGPEEIDIEAVIAKGENETCEFKSSFELNFHTKKSSCADVRLAALKTIAGFLNKNGGQLFIGVNDDGKVIGIQEELRASYRGSVDKFKLKLSNVLIKNFDKFIVSKYVHIRDIEVRGQTIIVVDCNKSPRPIFLGDDFYVRVNPSTEKLTGAAVLKYCESHFSTGR